MAVPMLELFRARFRVAMAASGGERVSSRPVGFWGTVSMAETAGSCKRAVQYGVLGGTSDAPIRDVCSIYHDTSGAGIPAL